MAFSGGVVFMKMVGRLVTFNIRGCDGKALQLGKICLVRLVNERVRGREPVNPRR